MQPRSDLNRRHFIKTAALAGGASIASGFPLNAAAAEEPTADGETEHFWYRRRPKDLYIDSQRDDRAFAFRKGTILLSEDNGKTWPHSAEFPDAKKITWSCLLNPLQPAPHPTQGRKRL